MRRKGSDVAQSVSRPRRWSPLGSSLPERSTRAVGYLLAHYGSSARRLTRFTRTQEMSSRTPACACAKLSLRAATSVTRIPEILLINAHDVSHGPWVSVVDLDQKPFGT